MARHLLSFAALRISAAIGSTASVPFARRSLPALFCLPRSSGRQSHSTWRLSKPSSAAGENSDADAINGSAKVVGGFANLVISNKAAAIQQLLDAAAPWATTDPIEYCVPPKNDMWNEDNLKSQLVDLRETIIRPGLKAFETTQREPVVVDVRLGSGCGKTHVLLEAPRLLQAGGIYVTYDMEQHMYSDTRSPTKSLLIRLILAISGIDSASCSSFLCNRDAKLLIDRTISVQMLRDLFVYHVVETYKSRDIVIGVDEVKLLGAEVAQEVTSELGNVAHAYYKETGSVCTAIVSSLVESTFAAQSERIVHEWTPEAPDESAIDYFVHTIGGNEHKNRQGQHYCQWSVATTCVHLFLSAITSGSADQHACHTCSLKFSPDRVTTLEKLLCSK